MTVQVDSPASAGERDAFGRRIIELAARLAQWSETPDGLTCTYLTPAHRAAADDLRELMRAAGMTVEIDGVGNVVGRYAAADPAATKTLIVASHYDTVLNAGSYDGRLGILAGLVAVEHLNRSGRRLPFHLEVIGFAEEEGVRFSAHYIGSSAIAGCFDMRVLQRRDAGGQSVADVMHKAGFDPEAIPSLARRPQDLLGYIELHIEQGPVLEQKGLPVGVVTAIAGATRLAAHLTGMAGHAGTVPMAMRRDALAGAAECITKIEELCQTDGGGLVGTVGYIDAMPGATNVIPGRVNFTLDIRAPTDPHRKRAVADIVRHIEAIAKRRTLALQVDVTHENRTVPCAPWLKAQVAEAVDAEGFSVFELPSGAGHDGMAMIDIADVAMLFVRCRGGISHHPDEHVETADADAGARVLLRLIENFRPREAAPAVK